MTRSLIDMTGYVVGFLHVTGISEHKDSKGTTMWSCICARCGGTYEATGTTLRSGATVSCGCANRERDMRATKRNTATKHVLSGADLTISELADIAGVSYGHMRQTIGREGSAERALARLAHRVRQPKE